MNKNKLLFFFIIIFIGALIASNYFISDSTSTVTTDDGQKKAVIVDQLNFTKSNHTFVERTSSILKQAGYEVDYVPGRDVTVDLYEKLPTHGYDVIILRTHSAMYPSKKGPVDLFTCEPYQKDKYVFEQLNGILGKVTYNNSTMDNTYFSITTKFVSNMEGDFDNATIILMGCDGLINNELGKEFVDKGAKVFIGWNGAVLARHSDRATTYFLENFVTKEMTVEKATITTMGKKGTDPLHDSTLRYYPLDAGHLRVYN